MSRERCLFLLPQTPQTNQLFPESTMRGLREMVDLKINPTSRHLSQSALLEYAEDIHYIITGWGTPKIAPSILGPAPDLKAIFHSAGTIKPIVDEEIFSLGVTVTSANHVMSRVTAEAGVAMAMMGNWGIRYWLGGMQRGEWKTKETVVPGIQGQRIGIIGYGAITRAMLPMLKPFCASPIIIQSNHLTDDEASAQGLELSHLDDLLRIADIIFLQTGLTDRTYRMIDRRRLDLIKSDALFVNLGRGELVDEESLVEVLLTGRFRAVLDVYTEEPLSADSPLRSLPNVICLPHLGAATIYCREQMGLNVLNGVRAMIDGQQPPGVIDRETSGQMSRR